MCEERGGTIQCLTGGNLSPTLPQEIGEQAQGGKITFGEKENRTLADLDTALETALLAFTDGLFTVFINDEEVKTLDTPLTIEADTIITFIRLTFLVGGYW